jgi:hypothetical protein
MMILLFFAIAISWSLLKAAENPKQLQFTRTCIDCFNGVVIAAGRTASMTW